MKKKEPVTTERDERLTLRCSIMNMDNVACKQVDKGPEYEFLNIKLRRNCLVLKLS